MIQTDAYKISYPRSLDTSVVFASPHSGREYLPEFLDAAHLDSHAVRSSEDAFLDDLFDAAPTFGAPFLCAKAPRAYVDLNRGCDELDPAVIRGVRRRGHSPRILNGLGVIPRVVANGRTIYRGKIDLAEAQSRLNTYWHPYHNTLKETLDMAHQSFGQAILIDLHSMPHDALENSCPMGSARPDVVLGDRFGASASSSVVEMIESAFSTVGLKVARNMPFAGAYICQSYGRPSRRQHAVQVEIDRRLYMDEKAIQPNANYMAFKAVMTEALQLMSDIGRPKYRRFAAE